MNLSQFELYLELSSEVPQDLFDWPSSFLDILSYA